MKQIIQILREELIGGEVPPWKRVKVSIQDTPQGVAKEILAGSPGTSTVLVGLVSRKGAETLTFQAWEGSRDGFPYLLVAL